MNKQSLMNQAWTIAKNAAAQFGGRAKQYFAEALKMAWASIKTPASRWNVALINQIGNEWVKGDHHRIYINDYAEIIGLVVNRYKTGNISSATLNGEKVSNSKAGKMLGGKVWYDVKADKLCASG